MCCVSWMITYKVLVHSELQWVLFQPIVIQNGQALYMSTFPIYSWKSLPAFISLEKKANSWFLLIFSSSSSFLATLLFHKTRSIHKPKEELGEPASNGEVPSMEFPNHYLYKWQIQLLNCIAIYICQNIKMWNLTKWWLFTRLALLPAVA